MYGLEIYNESGLLTLGMDHFTVEKIFEVTIPKMTGRGNGWRSDYLEYSVPGYDPATCFVVITPKVYAGYDQPGIDDGWGFTPTFKDIGLDRIAIIPYCNYNEVDFQGNYPQYWMYRNVESVVEVVKVL